MVMTIVILSGQCEMWMFMLTVQAYKFQISRCMKPSPVLSESQAKLFNKNISSFPCRLIDDINDPL